MSNSQQQRPQRTTQETHSDQVTPTPPAPLLPAQIVTIGAEVLTQVATPINHLDGRVAAVIAQLSTTLLAYRQRTGYGRAIAAPQIGVSSRLIVLHLGVGPIVLINPEITWRSEEMQTVWDDCLSVPEQMVQVQRHASVSLRYLDASGRVRTWQRLPADLAELIQHEIDHLDGILMTARAVSKEDLRPISQRVALIGARHSHTRLQLAHVSEAAALIEPVFLNSPQFESEPLSQLLECQITVKLETLNPIRSFKGRGASYLIAQLQQRGESRALVAASAGNWGQALAYVCRSHALPLTIYAATNANPLKVARMRALGAELRLQGDDFDAAKLAAKEYAEATHGLFLEDGLDPAVSEGHGTIAYELLNQGACFDVLLAPLGNGALLNGIALWSKAADPAVEIIGVCAEGAPSMRDSWRQGPGQKVVSYTQVETIADGIGVRLPIAEAVDDMHRHVDDVVLVNDTQLIQAMRMAHEHLGVIIEPAGAAGLAAVIAYPERFQGRRVALVLCGSNLSPEQMNTWLN